LCVAPVPPGAVLIEGGQAGRPARLLYLEGLRGVAALQVVLLHFVTAFLPALPDRAGLAGFVFDGHSAVYLFFLISGAVLSLAFARQGVGIAGRIAQRVVRIGLPVAAACVLAALLLALLPDAHLRAARLSGSAWFAMDESGPVSWWQAAREVGEEAMVTGYADTTLLPAGLATWLGLDPLAHSLDAPFWSLHLEMAGSLLVLALVRLRAASRAAHAVAVVPCLVLFGSQACFLFVLGHLAACRLGHPPPGGRAGLAGAILLAAGIAMCAAKDWASVDALRAGLAHLVVFPTPNLFQFQSQLGAVLVFAGIALLPRARLVLQAAPIQALGRLSFGIYLTHFPILFTVVAASWTMLAARIPAWANGGLALILLLAATLLAASAFERCIDRPAIALGRRIARAGHDPRPQLGPTTR
jgi:peptidoglycan/LPS O-acetylase OafA/YrhL